MRVYGTVRCFNGEGNAPFSDAAHEKESVCGAPCVRNVKMVWLWPCFVCGKAFILGCWRQVRPCAYNMRHKPPPDAGACAFYYGSALPFYDGNGLLCDERAGVKMFSHHMNTDARQTFVRPKRPEERRWSSMARQQGGVNVERRAGGKRQQGAWKPLVKAGDAEKIGMEGGNLFGNGGRGALVHLPNGDAMFPSQRDDAGCNGAGEERKVADRGRRGEWDKRRRFRRGVPDKNAHHVNAGVQ